MEDSGCTLYRPQLHNLSGKKKHDVSAFKPELVKFTKLNSQPELCRNTLNYLVVRTKSGYLVLIDHLFYVKFQIIHWYDLLKHLN